MKRKLKLTPEIRRALRVWIAIASVVLFWMASVEQTQSGVVKTGDQSASALRDGQHDFDFLFGRWKVHCRRLLHPLSGSSQWIEFDGVNTVHRVWEGRANMDEFEADTPSGHIEGMTIRTYSTKSHQWSIYWSTQASGTVDFPPMVGEFRNGKGEFYDTEKYNGEGIFVRFVWTISSPDSCHWEQAFSADGGKTWETNFIWDLTREKP